MSNSAKLGNSRSDRAVVSCCITVIIACLLGLFVITKKVVAVGKEGRNVENTVPDASDPPVVLVEHYKKWNDLHIYRIRDVKTGECFFIVNHGPYSRAPIAITHIPNSAPKP